MADDVEPSVPSWLQRHAAEFLEPQVDQQADALKSFAARQAAISEKLWKGLPAHQYSDTDLGDGDLGGGKVYDYHRMNPSSAARMLDRIHTRRDLTAAGVSELPTVAESFDVPDAVDTTGATPSADSTPKRAPDVVLPSSAQIVDPGAFMPMDNDGYRDDDKAAQGTAANPNYVPKPAASTQDPKQAVNNKPQDQSSTNQGQPANDRTTPAPLPDNPAVPVAQQVAGPVEGVPWDTPTGDGGVATSVIVPGYGGQTIDTTIHNGDGTVTQVRSVRDPETGGVTTWTANADGSLSVRYPDGTNGAEPGKAKIYTVPAGQNPSGPAPIRTDITANSKSADTTSRNADGSESTAHSETLSNGNVATTYHNPDNSTASTISSPADHGQVVTTPTGYVDSNGYGWRIDEHGKRWEISPKANGNIAESMVGPKGNSVASREYGPNGDLLSAWDSETGQTMSTMSLAEAQAKAKNDFDRYLAARWMTSPVRDHSDLRDDKEITARAERLAALNSVTADPSTPVRITVDRTGKFLFVGVTGPDLVEHMTAPGENLGPSFKFDVHPDGKITDPDGNRLVEVNDSIVRVDPSGKVIIPENALAGRPGIGWRNPSGDPLEEGFTDGAIDKRIATSRFVFRPDEGKYHEIAEVPAPGDIPGTKFYKVQGGGVLFEDITGLHWATDPGQVPSLSERLKGVAIDTALLAAGEGVGWVIGRGIAAATRFSIRTGAETAAESAEIAVGRAGRQPSDAGEARPGNANRTNEQQSVPSRDPGNPESPQSAPTRGSLPRAEAPADITVNPRPGKTAVDGERPQVVNETTVDLEVPRGGDVTDTASQVGPRVREAVKDALGVEPELPAALPRLTSDGPRFGTPAEVAGAEQSAATASFDGPWPSGAGWVEQPDAVAGRLYEAIRATPNRVDLPEISKNTGIDESILRDVKSHLFRSQHDVVVAPGQIRRGLFTPREDIGALWQEAQAGTLTAEALAKFRSLIAHEYIERGLMKSGLPYIRDSPEVWELDAETGKYYRQRVPANIVNAGAHELAPHSVEGTFKWKRPWGVEAPPLSLKGNLADLGDILKETIRMLREMGMDIR